MQLHYDIFVHSIVGELISLKLMSVYKICIQQKYYSGQK